MSINDARRLRSGERRALSELRKTTEDVAEHVQKAEGSRKDAKEHVKGLKRCFTYILHHNYIIYYSMFVVSYIYNYDIIDIILIQFML